MRETSDARRLESGGGGPRVVSPGAGASLRSRRKPETRREKRMEWGAKERLDAGSRGGDAVKVAVRVRPMSVGETSAGLQVRTSHHISPTVA